MGLFYLFVIICVITSAKSEAFVIQSDDTPEINHRSSTVKRDAAYGCPRNGVVIQTYGVYLIGFTMLIMLIAIIGLAVALYLIIKKRKVFGLSINNNSQYVRQESTGIATLYSRNYDNEQTNKNDGSTLTVNSGIIEINRISDPETPTRIDESRIMFTKKPVNPMVPIIQKGQMDEICKAVLKRKVQKSDSASFRDLNELLNMDKKFGAKYEPVKETAKEEKKVLKTENGTKQEMNQETKNDPKQETEEESKIEPQQETKCESQLETKHEENTGTLLETKSNVKIDVKDVNEDIHTENSDTETEYDTVPNPIRFRHSGPPCDDFDIDDIPVYDLPPPRRSFDGQSRNTMIHIDHDTQYLLPLSANQTDSCYINAKRNSYTST